MLAGTAFRAGVPVPRSTASRIMSRTMKAMRGSMLDCIVDGARCSTTRPPASSMRVTRRGSTALPRLAHTVYAAT
jgi:hypothetical protein